MYEKYRKPVLRKNREKAKPAKTDPEDMGKPTSSAAAGRRRTTPELPLGFVEQPEEVGPPQKPYKGPNPLGDFIKKHLVPKEEK